MLRFSVRDAIWLTAFVAVCLAWYLHVRTKEREKEEALHKFAENAIRQSADSQWLFDNLHGDLERYKQAYGPLPSGELGDFQPATRDQTRGGPPPSYKRLRTIDD